MGWPGMAGADPCCHQAGAAGITAHPSGGATGAIRVPGVQPVPAPAPLTPVTGRQPATAPSAPTTGYRPPATAYEATGQPPHLTSAPGPARGHHPTTSTSAAAAVAPGATWVPPAWPAPPWAVPAGGNTPSAAALENAARRYGVDVDKFAEHAAHDTESKAKPPAPELRLAGVSADAAQLLRLRSRFVSVDASISGGGRGPQTVQAYVARVAELMAHRAYHFPGVGLQLTLYIAWLLRRSIGRSLLDVRTADTKARELMATRPTQLMTAVDFDHIAELGPAAPVTAPVSSFRSLTECRNFREGRCQPGPHCPYRRQHQPCAICHSSDHHTDCHPGPSQQWPATRGRGGRRQ